VFVGVSFRVMGCVRVRAQILGHRNLFHLHNKLNPPGNGNVTGAADCTELSRNTRDRLFQSAVALQGRRALWHPRLAGLCRRAFLPRARFRRRHPVALERYLLLHDHGLLRFLDHGLLRILGLAKDLQGSLRGLGRADLHGLSGGLGGGLGFGVPWISKALQGSLRGLGRAGLHGLGSGLGGGLAFGRARHLESGLCSLGKSQRRFIDFLCGPRSSAGPAVT